MTQLEAGEISFVEPHITREREFVSFGIPDFETIIFLGIAKENHLASFRLEVATLVFGDVHVCTTAKDMNIFKRLKFVTSVDNYEAKKELQTIGRMTRADPLSPVGFYLKNMVLPGAGLLLEG